MKKSEVSTKTGREAATIIIKRPFLDFTQNFWRKKNNFSPREFRKLLRRQREGGIIDGLFEARVSTHINDPFDEQQLWALVLYMSVGGGGGGAVQCSRLDDYQCPLAFKRQNNE